MCIPESAKKGGPENAPTYVHHKIRKNRRTRKYPNTSTQRLPGNRKCETEQRSSAAQERDRAYSRKEEVTGSDGRA